jgi:hypothetical protein
VASGSAYVLDEFEVDIEVSMRPPFSPSTLCLEDYLDSLAFAGQISKGYARLSNNDVVATLHNITKAVLSAADTFFAEVTPERLAALHRSNETTDERS